MKSKRVKGLIAILTGAQALDEQSIDGWWTKAWDYFSDQPDVLMTMWRHAWLFTTGTWLGRVLFFGGLAFVVWTYFYDRRPEPAPAAKP